MPPEKEHQILAPVSDRRCASRLRVIPVGPPDVRMSYVRQFSCSPADGSGFHHREPGIGWCTQDILTLARVKTIQKRYLLRSTLHRPKTATLDGINFIPQCRRLLKLKILCMRKHFLLEFGHRLAQTGCRHGFVIGCLLADKQ